MENYGSMRDGSFLVLDGGRKMVERLRRVLEKKFGEAGVKCFIGRGKRVSERYNINVLGFGSRQGNDRPDTRDDNGKVMDCVIWVCNWWTSTKHDILAILKKLTHPNGC